MSQLQKYHSPHLCSVCTHQWYTCDRITPSTNERPQQPWPLKSKISFETTKFRMYLVKKPVSILKTHTFKVQNTDSWYSRQTQIWRQLKARVRATEEAAQDLFHSWKINSLLVYRCQQWKPKYQLTVFTVCIITQDQHRLVSANVSIGHFSTKHSETKQVSEAVFLGKKIQALMETKPSNYIQHSRKSDRRIQKWWEETILGCRPQNQSYCSIRRG